MERIDHNPWGDENVGKVRDACPTPQAAKKVGYWQTPNPITHDLENKPPFLSEINTKKQFVAFHERSIRVLDPDEFHENYVELQNPTQPLSHPQKKQQKHREKTKG